MSDLPLCLSFPNDSIELPQAYKALDIISLQYLTSLNPHSISPWYWQGLFPCVHRIQADISATHESNALLTLREVEWVLCNPSIHEGLNYHCFPLHLPPNHWDFLSDSPPDPSPAPCLPLTIVSEMIFQLPPTVVNYAHCQPALQWLSSSSLCHQLPLPCEAHKRPGSPQSCSCVPTLPRPPLFFVMFALSLSL